MTASGAVATRDRELRVLLVEDDDGDALMLEDLINDPTNPEASSVRFIRARTIAEAMRLAKSGADGPGADCVLLDLGLPDSIGLDGLDRLLDLTNVPPIVVVTGHTDIGHGLAAVAAGAQDYVVKGQLSADSLTRVLHYAIERQRAQDVSAELHVARLQERENRRLESGLLPTPLLSDPQLVFSARYEPGHRQLLLGGDFYDAVEGDDATLHLLIGDVSGHGAEEAALGVLLRIAWRTLVLAGTPADRIAAILQRVLISERQQRFVFTTVGMVTISPQRDQLRYWLAGHPPPILITTAGVQVLPTAHRGLPLGIDRDARWLDHTVGLPPSWALMLCTDGLFEGTNERGDGQLWLDGLQDLIAQLGSRLGGLESWRHRPDDLLPALVGRIKELDPDHTDDLAAVLLTRLPD